MKVIGIVVEYNPFHNGHLYQINKIKKLYKNSTIIIILSSHFTQRGIPSLINKWDKTRIALNYGVDLVVELPFPFSSQSADIFACGSIKLLNELKIDTLVFGSESDNLNMLKEIAKVQINNKKFDDLVKKYLKNGINYPTALNKAVKEITGFETNNPNDLLGISYIKEIIKNNYNIEIKLIKRENNFHDIKEDKNIISATNIRNKINNNEYINKYVPNLTLNYLNKNIDENYFKYLKYKILSDNDLSKYQTVDEGLEHKIKKEITNANSLDELIKKIKTKRYTYNKIYRMLTHILVGFTKEDAKTFKEIEYIRVLGFTTKGKKHLKSIKKEVNLPIITTFNKKYKMLEYELKITSIYSILIDNFNLIELEYKNTPIKS